MSINSPLSIEICYTVAHISAPMAGRRNVCYSGLQALVRASQDAYARPINPLRNTAPNRAIRPARCLFRYKRQGPV